jgi:D-alanine-D-alanine ligase
MALKTKSPTQRVTAPRTFKVLLLYSVMSDWTTDDTALSEEATSRMYRSLKSVGLDVTAVAVRRDVEGAIKNYDPREYVIFNWCEGLDGQPNSYDLIPPVLEQYGFAYTGAGAWSLAATQNKAVTKKVLLDNKIPTPVSKLYDVAKLNGWRRYPALVKPANEHCSYGITRDSVVDNSPQLKTRIQYVLDQWKETALVEDFIDGAEYNVAIWGNDDALEVLPVGSIIFDAFPDYHDRLVTFDAKWNPESEAYRLTGVQCPAVMDATLERRVKRVGMAAFRALQLRDYGRIDIRVRNGVPYVLDVNANPDITMEGGFARSARAAGYDYGMAISRILGFAARRMPGA